MKNKKLFLKKDMFAFYMVELQVLYDSNKFRNCLLAKQSFLIYFHTFWNQISEENGSGIF